MTFFREGRRITAITMYSYRCLCILTVVYVFLDAANLTEIFPCFFLVLRQMPGYN